MMAQTCRQRNGGYTLFELSVALVLIVVVIGVFLNRVPYYQEQAERVAMEQVVGAVQSALVLRYGTLKARDAVSAESLRSLRTDNPVDWLQQRPSNYAGEYFEPEQQSIEPGQWVFDLKARELLYVLQHADHFKSDQGEARWIRFQVRFENDASLPSKASPQQVHEPTSILFVPAVPYHWFD